VENNFFFLFINKNYNLCGLSITKFIFVQILLQLMVTISLSTLANVLSIVVNLLLLLLKLIVGFIFNSISLVADGFDSVLDLVTAAFAGIGERISRKPADKSHPFGHQKFQFIHILDLHETLLNNHKYQFNYKTCFLSHSRSYEDKRKYFYEESIKKVDKNLGNYFNKLLNFY